MTKKIECLECLTKQYNTLGSTALSKSYIIIADWYTFTQQKGYIMCISVPLM